MVDTPHVNKIQGRIYAALLLVINLCCLAVGVMLALQGLDSKQYWLYGIGVCIIGLMQYILGFCLPHQAVHGTLFFHSTIDRFWGDMFLRTCMLWTFDLYRKEHFAHHKHTKDPMQDPGEEEYRFRGLQPDRYGFYLRIIHPLRLILIGKDIQRLRGDMQKEPSLAKKLGWVWILICMIAVLTQSIAFVRRVRVVPLLTTRFLFVYRSEVSDHRQTTTRNPIGFFVFRIMRGPLGRRDGYHHIHHSNAAIPWYQLPMTYHKHRSKTPQPSTLSSLVCALGDGGKPAQDKKQSILVPG